MAELKYAQYEGHPTIFDDREAWFLYDDDIGWKPLPLADALIDGGLMSREAFRKNYPNLPDLPRDAFRNPGSARPSPRPAAGNASRPNRR